MLFVKYLKSYYVFDKHHQFKMHWCVWFFTEMLIRCTDVCRSSNSFQECLLSMLMIFIDAAVHQCTETHTV